MGETPPVRLRLARYFKHRTHVRLGYGHANLGTRRPDLTRPIAAPLDRCTELLGVDLAAVREAAANVEPYLRADGHYT